MFRARGEKQRFGLFKDNILVTESKVKNKIDSQTSFPNMIPEIMTTRARTKRKRFVGKSANPPS